MKNKFNFFPFLYFLKYVYLKRSQFFADNKIEFLSRIHKV